MNRFFSVNVLENPEIRAGIKDYANWPTIPQPFVKGEFVGGPDIMTEMYRKVSCRSCSKAWPTRPEHDAAMRHVEGEARGPFLSSCCLPCWWRRQRPALARPHRGRRAGGRARAGHGGGSPRKRRRPAMKRLPAKLACRAFALLRDQSYGEHPRQRFDGNLLASPNAAALKDAPVLLLVHGGGWAHGDKAARSVVENKVARWVPRGFIVVSANYRLLPDAQPVAQANDIARALATGAAAGARLGRGCAPTRAHAVIPPAPIWCPCWRRRRKSPAWPVPRPGAATVALDSAGFDVEKIMRPSLLAL